MKLDIGSGDARYLDYTTVDLYAPADIRADMGALPLPDGSVEAIWASHVIEHCLPECVQSTLREWLRVLAPGGTALIMTPDLDAACRAWLERAPGANSMIYGSVGPGQQHYIGWGAVELRDELATAGFEVLSVQPIRETAEQNCGGTFVHLMVNLVAEVRKPLSEG